MLLAGSHVERDEVTEWDSAGYHMPEARILRSDMACTNRGTISPETGCWDVGRGVACSRPSRLIASGSHAGAVHRSGVRTVDGRRDGGIEGIGGSRTAAPA